MTTDYLAKANILGEIFVEYKGDERFSDFFQYNDLGLPLAYAISAEIIPSSSCAQTFVEETFDVFLSALDLEDDGYESLEDILIAANQEL